MFPAKLTNMNRISRILSLTVVVGLTPHVVTAQSFAAVGTRAAGMGGAFVGVADDASAIYWNPAGLAVGT
jgi:long-chain fatty acid transport protein